MEQEEAGDDALQDAGTPLENGPLSDGPTLGQRLEALQLKARAVCCPLCKISVPYFLYTRSAFPAVLTMDSCLIPFSAASCLLSCKCPMPRATSFTGPPRFSIELHVRLLLFIAGRHGCG